MSDTHIMPNHCFFLVMLWCTWTTESFVLGTQKWDKHEGGSDQSNHSSIHLYTKLCLQNISLSSLYIHKKTQIWTSLLHAR